MPKQQTAAADLADLLPRMAHLMVEVLIDETRDYTPCEREAKRNAIESMKKYIAVLQSIIETAEATVEEPL